MMKQSNFIQKS